jgi:hypothetical protein
MKRVLFVTLFTVVFAFAMVGCGAGNNGPIQATGTSTTVQFGDATNDQIVKFELTVNSITLTDSSNTATANLLSSPVEFEFVQSAGTMEPVSLSHIPAGTYSKATFTVSDPDVVVLNGATPPAPVKIPATLTATSFDVTFASPITVGTDPLFLNFDLDLASSVTLTGTPPTSASVTPAFTASTSTVAPNNNQDDEDGEDDDVHGSVTAINAPNFTIQTTAGASIDFTTDANTRFKDGLTSLSDLKVGDIVEVDAETQTDGSKLATKVEREGNEQGEEAEGIISDISGTAPALTITIAHQVSSNQSTNPPVTVQITTDANTQFSVRGDKLNITGTFDATHIGKGQRVEADADGQASPIAARKLKLREQALVGTVSNATTNTFTLTLDPSSAFATLSGTTSLTVTLASGADMKTSLLDGATVRVRGLVFFDGTTYSMTAARVDDNK